MRKSLAVFVVCCLASHASGETITVDVQGISNPTGTIRCGLFESPAGFPDEPTQDRVIVIPASRDQNFCRFEAVSSGRVALAISHDANNNGELDKNFLGMPKESWGVSRGARPSLRPPRFDEAALDYDGKPLEIIVEIDR